MKYHGSGLLTCYKTTRHNWADNCCRTSSKYQLRLRPLSQEKQIAHSSNVATVSPQRNTCLAVNEKCVLCKVRPTMVSRIWLSLQLINYVRVT